MYYQIVVVFVVESFEMIVLVNQYYIYLDFVVVVHVIHLLMDYIWNFVVDSLVHVIHLLMDYILDLVVDSLVHVIHWLMDYILALALVLLTLALVLISFELVETLIQHLIHQLMVVFHVDQLDHVLYRVVWMVFVAEFVSYHFRLPYRYHFSFVMFLDQILKDHLILKR